MEPTRKTSEAQTLLDALLILIGLIALWLSMRYQSFLMGVFPPGLTVSLLGVELPAVSAFRVVTAAIAVFMLVFERRLDRWLVTSRLACAAAIACGSAAIGAVFLVQHGMLAPWWLWPSSVLLNASLLIACLSWAILLGERFDSRLIILMGLSLPLSIPIPVPDLTAQTWDVVAYCLSIPLALAIPLAILARRGQSEAGIEVAEASPGCETPLATRWPANPLVWCLCLFLLIGSFVRGIVDIDAIASPGGFWIAIGVSAAFAAGCVAFGLRVGCDDGAEVPEAELDRFVLVCWVVLAGLLFVGILVFLVFNQVSLGGDLVVMARSTLQVLLWIALCDYVHRYAVPAVPLFMVCVVLVEVASWLLSYAVVPLVFASGSEIDLYTFIVTSIFLLMGCALVFFVARSSAKDGHAPQESLAPAEIEETPGRLDGYELQVALQDAYGLTAREAQIALGYADGYSLKKVAEHLGIKQSTAQGYIRKVYSKLGINTKDELVDLVKETRGA